jgi:hypothetical protein
MRPKARRQEVPLPAYKQRRNGERHEKNAWFYTFLGSRRHDHYAFYNKWDIGRMYNYFVTDIGL